MFPIDRLEVIVGALLAVVAVGVVVLMVVGALMYLLFREPRHATPSPAMPYPKVVPPAQDRQGTTIPTAIAG